MSSLPKSPTPAAEAGSGALTTGTFVPTADHAGGSKFPPFDPGSFAPQLVWLAITFVALYLLLARKALPGIGSVLAERRDRVERDLAEAQRMKGETDAALKAYEQSLADARGRAQALAKDTRDRLAAEIERDRHRADEQNAQKLAETEKRIADSKARALSSVGDIAAETAQAIVAKLLGRDVTREDVRRAVAATERS